MRCTLKSLFSLICLSVASYGEAETTSKPVKIIEPNKPVTTTQAAAIDTEHFELGAHIGLMSIEDFNTNPVNGISLTYHINNKFISQIAYGTSTVSRTGAERFEDLNYLSDSAREFKYLNFMAGYDILDGRSFLGKKRKFNSAIYLMGGISKVTFALNNNPGTVFGISYRVVVTDWLTANLDFRDTLFKREYLNDNKKTNNTEMFIGINALF